MPSLWLVFLMWSMSEDSWVSDSTCSVLFPDAELGLSRGASGRQSSALEKGLLIR